jgi:hypothetical protein
MCVSRKVSCVATLLRPNYAYIQVLHMAHSIAIELTDLTLPNAALPTLKTSLFLCRDMPNPTTQPAARQLA